MDAFKWQGEQLCLPQNVSSLAVYYNRDLFEKYGVAEPPAGWTWNELITTAVAMTRDAHGNQVVGHRDRGRRAPVAVYGLGVEPSMIRLAPFVWSNGGEIVDDPAQPTRFTLDTPEAREALKNFVDLRLAYGVIPTDEEVEAEDDETRFPNGRLAMLMSSRRVTTTFRAIERLRLGRGAAAGLRASRSGILHSDAYCMTAAAREQGRGLAASSSTR